MQFLCHEFDMNILSRLYFDITPVQQIHVCIRVKEKNSQVNQYGHKQINVHINVFTWCCFNLIITDLNILADIISYPLIYLSVNIFLKLYKSCSERKL